MKRFIINTAIFALLILLLACVADYAISKGLRRTERAHFYTMNALMNDTLNADVVILGSSRAACSYNTLIIDSLLNVNSRNLGVSAQPFRVSYLRWQLYKRNNKNPKLLIVNVDFRDLRNTTSGFEREQYYPYMSDSLVKPYLDQFKFSWAEKHIPMYRYRGDYKIMALGFAELLHIYHDTKGHYYKGYSNDNSRWDGRNLDYVLSKGKIKGNYSSETVQLMDDFLQEVTRDGIPVVFVYAPLYKRLKVNLREDKPRAAYQALSQKYDVPFLDFSEMEFSSDSSYFMNGHHVNRKGARAFTIKLAQSIDSLGIIR